VGIKRLTVLVSLFMPPTGFLLSGIGDTGISIADTSVPDDETASSPSEANNSCASATITITMTPVSLPDREWSVDEYSD